MNYHKQADIKYLERMKGRYLDRIASAEESVKRHTGVRGYGNETLLEMFESRVIELKQRVFEINLELENLK